ncbi:OsmC/Ohr family [Chytriomyces cf. hyalinus JEL632]|nr:OsmC/Ohr family [Chytriomyces cf. hyalinus JEL632]
MLSSARSCATRLRAKCGTCRHLLSTAVSLCRFDANREVTNVVVTSDAAPAQNKFRFIGRDQASNAQVAMAINHTDTTATTPMSLLLIALGGCMAMNVQLLLSNKKLPVSSIRTEIRAQKRKAPIAALKDTEPWESIHVHLIIESDDVEEMHRKENTVRELVAASIEKYCGVHKTLQAEISWDHSVESAVVK